MALDMSLSELFAHLVVEVQARSKMAPSRIDTPEGKYSRDLREWHLGPRQFDGQIRPHKLSIIREHIDDPALERVIVWIGFARDLDVASVLKFRDLSDWTATQLQAVIGILVGEINHAIAAGPKINLELFDRLAPKPVTSPQ